MIVILRPTHTLPVQTVKLSVFAYFSAKTKFFSNFFTISKPIWAMQVVDLQNKLGPNFWKKSKYLIKTRQSKIFKC